MTDFPGHDVGFFDGDATRWAVDTVTKGVIPQGGAYDLGSPTAPVGALHANTIGTFANPFGTMYLKTRIDVSALTPADSTDGCVISSNGTWTTFSVAGAAGIKLLFENSCNTGEFATVRLRARAANTTATGNGGNSIGTTTCLDLSTSANGHEFGVLKALNACAQPNAWNQTTDSSNIVTAVYGRIDATGTSVGRRWVSWIDTHATSKAAGGDYMERISHTEQ